MAVSVGRLWDDVQSTGFCCSQGFDPCTLSFLQTSIHSTEMHENEHRIADPESMVGYSVVVEGSATPFYFPIVAPPKN